MSFEMTPEELKRRIDTVSMLTATVRRLRQAALEAHARGDIPWKPLEDIRSDAAYWRRLMEEQGIAEPGPEPPPGESP